MPDDATPTPTPAPKPAPGPAPARRRSGAPEIPEILRDDRRAPVDPRIAKRRQREERRKSPEWRAMGIGLDFAAMVGGGCLLGFAIDVLLDTQPNGIVIGGALGVLSGGYSAYRMAMKLNRDMDAYERARKEGRDREGR